MAWTRRLGALLGAALLALALGTPGARGQNPLDVCGGKEGAQTSRCLYTTARQHQLWDEGKRQLEALVRADPRAPHPVFNLARLELDRGASDAASPLFERAAEGFARDGAALDEAYARINLAECLRIGGQLAAAAEPLERAIHLARGVGQPELEAHARLAGVRIARAQGEDLEGLRLRLLAMQAELFGGDEAPALGYGVRKTWLFELAGVLLDLYRLDEALAVNRRWAELAHQQGDGYGEATARVNMATSTSEMSWRDGAAEEALRLAEEGLALAEATGQTFAQLEALRLLGKLLPGEAGRGHLRRCLERAPAGGRERLLCHFALAASLADDDPEQARGALDQALAATAAAEDPWAGIYGWADQFQVLWAQPSESFGDDQRLQALDASLDILDRLEALRNRQGLAGRADAFAAVVQVYHALTGHLLDRPGGSDPADRAAAFAVSERMRGRVLLDQLRDAGGAEPAANLPDHFTTLDELTEELADDQAFFVFQVAPDQDVFGRPGGGSWLMVVCRGQTRLYPLPDGPTLATKLGLLLGLFEGEFADGPLVTEVAGALYQSLLAEAVDDLPPGIDHWILVPDGVLHLLPFGLLAPDVRLSTVPSATLWHHWRESPEVRASAALAFADPARPDVTRSTHGAQTLERDERLGRLPYARREGRRLVRRLGGASRLLVGDEASEEALNDRISNQYSSNQYSSNQYSIVHFATHALIDARNPSRSILLLAPGHRGEDGRLHPDEIMRLQLRGQLVVLSACQSASGKQRLGEGVESLARAFFLAGARSVVASLWRLRDDEAATFFDAFYAHLSRGETVSNAVAATRQELRSAGARPTAWAGVTVLGDGDWAPISPTRPPLRLGWGLALLGPLVLFLTLTIWRHRKT